MWFETLFSYPADAYETGTFLFANVFQPLHQLLMVVCYMFQNVVKLN